MCAAMKSTAEASSGWSSQTVQISPVSPAPGSPLHALDDLDQLVDRSFPPRSVVSLPTTIALTLL